jgi:hypothetical protein
MKIIDKEIFEVESRLHVREARIRQTAREAKARTLRALASPASLAGAVALGFIVASGLGRQRAKAPTPSRRTGDKRKSFALGSLAMTGVTWFIRSQFGGPVGLAQFVVSKIKNRKDSKPVVA